MKRSESVASIMTKEVITVNTGTPLKEVKRILLEGKIRHIPVMEDYRVVGIISKTDYLCLTTGTYGNHQEEADKAMMEMFTLTDLMVRHPVVISSTASIKDAAEIFIANDFHALPVVDEGHLVGIVSTNDVLRCLTEMLEYISGVYTRCSP